MLRSGMEKRGRGRNVVELGHHIVKLNSPILAIRLIEREPHSDPHPKILGNLKVVLVIIPQKITVIKRLCSQIFQKSVPLRPYRGLKFGKIKEKHAVFKPSALHPPLNCAMKVIAKLVIKAVFKPPKAEHILVKIIEEKFCREIRVKRTAFNAASQ